MQPSVHRFLAPPDRSGGETAGTRPGNGDVTGLSDAESRAEFSHELHIDVRHLVAALEGRSPSRAVEVGCGYGRLTPWIADRTRELHAVDPDPSLLAAARREHPEIHFQRARAEALPFADDSFDLAVTWGVLNHVPEASIREATAELDRVVVPGGSLVISEATDGTPDPRWEYRSIAEWRRLFSPRRLVRAARTEREAEPFRDPDREHVVMTFR